MYLSLPEPVHMQCWRIIKKKETKLFLDYNLPKNDNCQKQAYMNVSCLGIKHTFVLLDGLTHGNEVTLVWGWWINPVDHSHTELIVLCKHPSALIKFSFFFFLQWEKEWLIVAKGNSCRIETLAVSANTAHSWVPLQQLRKQNSPQEGISSKTIHFSDGSNYTSQFYLMSVRHLLWTYNVISPALIGKIVTNCSQSFSHIHTKARRLWVQDESPVVDWVKKWKNNLRFGWDQVYWIDKTMIIRVQSF